MSRAKELGYSEVVITGNFEYYRKYGFESALKYNIYYSGVDQSEESPFFIICILDKKKFDIKLGIYSDPDGFNVDKRQLEEFDKKFLPKIKEKREGQFE